MKLLLLFSLFGLVNTRNIASFKCHQTNTIDTYDQVKKFTLYTGNNEEFGLFLNTTILYLEILDYNEGNVILKKSFNHSSISTKYSLYSESANIVLYSKTYYTVKLVISYNIPVIVTINCK